MHPPDTAFTRSIFVVAVAGMPNDDIAVLAGRLLLLVISRT